MVSHNVPNNPLSGIAHFFRGFYLALQPGVKRHVLIPLGINILFFVPVIARGASVFQSVVQIFKAGTPQWLDWLAWLLGPAFVLATLLIAFYATSLLANFLAAPFMGPLAAAVDRTLTGQGPPEDAPKGVLAHLGKAFVDWGNELYKIGHLTLIASPLLLMFLLPVANTIAPPLVLVFSAWSLARVYIDPTLRNHHLAFGAQRRFLHGYRWTALGFGGTATVVMMIPGLNCLILPIAVAGGASLATARIRPYFADTNTDADAE